MGDFGLKSALSSLTSEALLEALALVVVASLVIMAMQTFVPKVAHKLGGKPKLYLLASVPLVRLLIIILTIILVVPILIEPSFENMVAIFGALGLALGFAFKDYVSSLIAGIVTLYEMPYRPGDWIEINGKYGEVRSIGTRAAEIVTPDDNVVIIPHSTLWAALIANGNDGSDNLMCVTEFHLRPGHDVRRVMALLRDVAFTSPLVKTWQPILVHVRNSEHGMRYLIKAYPLDPRDQFRFISELTSRGAEALTAEGLQFTTVPVAVT